MKCFRAEVMGSNPALKMTDLNVRRRVVVVLVVVVGVGVVVAAVETVRLLPTDAHFEADGVALVLTIGQANDRGGVVDTDGGQRRDADGRRVVEMAVAHGAVVVGFVGVDDDLS